MAAEHIFGSDLGALKGKTVHQEAVEVESSDIPLPLWTGIVMLFWLQMSCSSTNCHSLYLSLATYGLVLCNYSKHNKQKIYLEL